MMTIESLCAESVDCPLMGVGGGGVVVLAAAMRGNAVSVSVSTKATNANFAGFFILPFLWGGRIRWNCARL
jgi:hypothetical protein